MKVRVNQEAALVPVVPTDEERAELAGRDIRIMEKSSRLERLETALAQSATPEQIKQWILELCEAKDVKFDKFGKMIYVPNWNARDKGLTRVLEMLHYQTADIEGHRRMNPHHPSKILIQVIGDAQVKAASE